MPRENKYGNAHQKHTLVYYNGEKLFISKIAELEGVTKATLIRKYKETQDIYEAVRRAKESKEKNGNKQINYIDYNGERTTLNAIAKEKGISAKTLRNEYKKLDDIDLAIESIRKKQAEDNKKLIKYNEEELTFYKIAEKEGLAAQSLKKYFEDTGDIYEAVKLAKERQKRDKDNIVYVEYEGETLSLYALSKKLNIHRDTLANYYEKEKDIDKAIEHARNSIKDREARQTYTEYNGEILSIEAIAKAVGINGQTLRKHYDKAGDIYTAIENARTSKQQHDDFKTYVEYKGERLALSTIAKREHLKRETLKKNYEKTGDVNEAIRLTREAKENRHAILTPVEYNGEKLAISAIAQKEEIVATTLRDYYKKTNDIYKSVMLCKTLKINRKKRKQIVQTKKFGNLSYYDLSLIIGIKYNDLIKALNSGSSVDEIIETKEKNNFTVAERQNLRLENGQSLTEYCIENKLNYACIYRLMKIYGKTLEEAVASYNKNGQATPTSWIYEKYGLLLKHLLLKESIDVQRVISYMREDYLPLEQAIEQYIIRSNAKKCNIDKDWLEELYDVLSDDSLSKEDYDGYIKNFYVDENEEKCIKICKQQYTNIKRKILLFELSDVLCEGIFTPEEEKRLFEEYNITEDEVDVIFKDLYKRFTDPGVLMGKDQEEVITPEIEQKRDEKISKYKQMVRDIKQDNNIVFMMRFMVGPNVESNEECRNEIHRELDKEKQDSIVKK